MGRKLKRDYRKVMKGLKSHFKEFGIGAKSNEVFEMNVDMIRLA